jgi:hypothetical protein
MSGQLTIDGGIDGQAHLIEDHTARRIEVFYLGGLEPCRPIVSLARMHQCEVI